MRINKRKKNTKKLYIIIAIVSLLIICALAGYFVLSLSNKDNSVVDNPENTSSETDSRSAQSNVDNDNQDVRESDKEPLQNDSASVDQNSLTGYITFKNITDGNLQIRVQIEQYLTSGTCTITIGDYVEQVNISANPSSSTCQGWDIPVAGIGSGYQSITIDITSDNNSLILSDGITI